jgi:hypothetical protein
MKLIVTALVVGVLITLGVGSILIFYGGLTAGVRLWAAWIPAGVCGVVSFALVIWRGYRMGEPVSRILRSLRELWDQIGKTPF